MPREPIEIEIELKDGESVTRKFVSGATTVVLRFRAEDRHPWPVVAVATAGNAVVGEATLCVDPVRAAVLKEQERCKAAVRRVLPREDQGQCVAGIFSAIDAPPEEVSEFAKGAAAMHRTMLDLVRRWKGAALTTTRFEHMVVALEGLKEPTP